MLDSLEEEKPYLLEKFDSYVPLVVEIGSGSGIITTFLQQQIIQQSICIATDLNPHACKTTLETSEINKGSRFIDAIQSDLTASIRPKSIDILLFNPPYVPAEVVPEIPKDEDAYEWLDLALLGGSDGMVVTNKLLEELDSILSCNGIAYILFCARNKPKEVAKHMQSKGWEADEVIFRKAGWEELSVYKFQRKR
jgi:release factor glutamine methyltransferase